ncbi:hypothetical protein [Pseudaestuariivita rosea]|uniref:hypothetical protein n=1 Tax=Pseudaestuariivita rosea TaxID=2763263 RepID=UPI001ABA3414|nr:hypothetical protein [Pseudaestuariivita rosea]
MKLLLAFVCAVYFFAANSTFACTFPEQPEDYVLPPISIKNDCSFYREELYWPANGQAAQDLGDSRVSQIIEISFGTAVIVSDCSRVETITIFGKEIGEETSCGQPYEIESHIKPEGRFDLTKGDDLVRLATVAKRQRFQVTIGAARLNISEPVNRQIDAFCGCKVFYPASAGAME